MQKLEMGMFIMGFAFCLGAGIFYWFWGLGKVLNKISSLRRGSDPYLQKVFLGAGLMVHFFGIIIMAMSLWDAKSPKVIVANLLLFLLSIIWVGLIAIWPRFLYYAAYSRLRELSKSTPS